MGSGVSEKEAQRALEELYNIPSRSISMSVQRCPICVANAAKQAGSVRRDPGGERATLSSHHCNGRGQAAI